MDFAFSEKELAFAEEARAWLETNVPQEWRRDHAWSRAEDPLWLEIAREWQRRCSRAAGRRSRGRASTAAAAPR